MKSFFSCYCYPTTIICVDDDVHFLKWLKSFFEAYNQTKVFHDPFSALQFLKDHENTALKQVTFNINHIDQSIHALHEVIYSQNRFQDISTVIVDYYMPGMDGVDFCHELKGRAYQKIMLTGEADQALAVSAFNAGLIDQFIMKGQEDALKKIQRLSYKMQRQFFINRTFPLTMPLLKFNPDIFAYYLDATCCEALYTLLEEMSVREFYLFNEEGDYLLIDEDHSLWWLTVKTQKACEDLIREAKAAFLEEPSEEAKVVYDLIESREKLPLFALSHERLDIQDWQAVMVAPVEIKTSQNTYQVLVKKDIQKAALDYDKICFSGL